MALLSFAVPVIFSKHCLAASGGKAACCRQQILSLNKYAMSAYSVLVPGVDLMMNNRTFYQNHTLVILASYS